MRRLQTGQCAIWYSLHLSPDVSVHLCVCSEKVNSSPTATVFAMSLTVTFNKELKLNEPVFCDEPDDPIQYNWVTYQENGLNLHVA